MSKEKIFLLMIGPKCFVEKDDLWRLTLVSSSKNAFKSKDYKTLHTMMLNIRKHYGLNSVIVTEEEMKKRKG